MSDWRTLEVYSTFIKVTGELETVRPDRVSDAINRFGDYLLLRSARAEPISGSYPILARGERLVTVTKAAAALIFPVDDAGDGNPALWREKVATPAAINTPRPRAGASASRAASASGAGARSPATTG